MSQQVSRGRTARAAASRLAVPALVAVGAFVGANIRHAVAVGLPGIGGTLVANVVGAAMLGALLSDATIGGRFSRETRLLLGTGLLSSFTTYSTFALDAVTATPASAVGYVAATYALGFAGVVLGRESARRLVGDRA